MKTLLVIAVLCAASLAFAQYPMPDEDLIAYYNGSATILENTGDDAIGIEIISFRDDYNGIAANSLPGPFAGFTALCQTSDDLTVYDFNEGYTMAAGESVNLGVIKSTPGTWGHAFYLSDGPGGYSTAYIFYWVPEPASVCLLGIGGVTLLRRRRR